MGLGTAVYRGGRKNVLFVLPLQEGVKPKEGVISITSLPTARENEPRKPCFSQWKLPDVNYDNLDGVLVIGGLILRYDEKRNC